MLSLDTSCSQPRQIPPSSARQTDGHILGVSILSLYNLALSFGLDAARNLQPEMPISLIASVHIQNLRFLHGFLADYSP